jgi:hypothetical protein
MPADATSQPTAFKMRESRKPAPATPMIDAIIPGGVLLAMCVAMTNAIRHIPISAILLAAAKCNCLDQPTL